MLFIFVSILFIFAQNGDRVVSLLHDIDDQRIRFGGRIIFSEQFNFGIPGGENWLVKWETPEGDTLLLIYAIDLNIGEVVFRHGLGGIWLRPLVSLMESLPGHTVGDRQIGNFSNEGYDMILTLHTGGGDPMVHISAFDPQVGRIRLIFSENFDDRYENPPIRFIVYRGMYGFMVREGDPPQVAGGPTWIPDPPNPRAGRWFFYTWDREQFAFIEIGEVDETYIEGDWRPGESSVVELMQEQTANEFTEVPNESETANITITPVVDDFAENQPIQAPAVIVPQADFVTEGGGMLLWAWFAIIGGVVVAGVAVLVVVQRKKK